MPQLSSTSSCLGTFSMFLVGAREFSAPGRGQTQVSQMLELQGWDCQQRCLEVMGKPQPPTPKAAAQLPPPAQPSASRTSVPVQPPLTCLLHSQGELGRPGRKVGYSHICVGKCT